MWYCARREFGLAGDEIPHGAQIVCVADAYDAIVRGEATEQELLAESGHPNTYTLTK